MQDRQLTGAHSFEINQLPDHLLAVIVLYQCEASASPVFQLLQQDKRIHVLLYDNSPEPQTPPQAPSITYVHNPSNPGIGVACNHAYRLASKLHKNWLLILDQDTTLPENALDAYGAAVVRHPHQTIFAPWVSDENGILSPFRFRWGKGWRIRKSPLTKIDLHSHMVINSGILIRTDRFEAAGGYNENIPLDFSDITFLRRLSRTEPSVFLVPVDATQVFADSQLQSTAARVTRFSTYCKGAFEFSREANNHLTPLACLVRAMRLTVRCLDAQFIRTFILTWRSQ